MIIGSEVSCIVVAGNVIEVFKSRVRRRTIELHVGEHLAKFRSFFFELSVLLKDFVMVVRNVV